MSVLDLIKQEKVNVLVAEPNPGFESVSFRDDLRDELLKLAELGERMEWVPCSERLPEDNQEVDVYLTIGKRFFDLKYVKNHNGFLDGGYEFDMDEVTHWRPAENDRPEEVLPT